MSRISSLVMAAVLGIASIASAQEAPPGEAGTEAELTAAFSALLAGNRADAEIGFRAAWERAPEGSRERWMGEQLLVFSQKLPEPALTEENPAAKEQFEKAFAFLLSQKNLEAQTLFLTGAILYPEGSSGRQFGQNLSKIAEAAAGFQAGAATPPVADPVAPPPALTPPAPVDAPPIDQDDSEGSLASGFSMVFNGAAYGVFGGIVSGIDLGVDDVRLAVGLPLAGGILGGLGGYAYYKGVHQGDFSAARASTITAGMLAGAGEGIFISLLADQLEGIEDTVFLATTVGLGAGLLASELASPRKGDSALALSGAIWATALTGEMLLITQPDNGTLNEAILTAGYNVGLLGGVLAASKVDMSTRRVAVINGSGALGTLFGALTGLLIVGDNLDGEGRFVAGSAMAGSLGGLTAGYLLSRNLDQSKTTEEETPAFSFQGLLPGSARGKTPQDKPLTLNAHFTF